MMLQYNLNNIFAKILRGEIPCKKVYESLHALAFEDVYPKAPVHVLIVPKGSYMNYSDFLSQAKEEEIIDFFKAVKMVAEKKNLLGQGYRLITNEGPDAHQEVHHFHVHLLGGVDLGAICGMR